MKLKGCKIIDEWFYRGLRTLILENELIKLTILVDYGAKIHELIHKPSGRDFLYHNPRVEVRAPVFGVNVDNWWTGGIDECIPTGHPCTYKGEEYPYLGEVWSLPWYYQILDRGPDTVSVHLWRPAIISPLLVEKWVSLRAGEKIVYFHHKISNLSQTNFEFIWGIHPGFQISSQHRIDIPAKKVVIEESFPDNRLGSSGSTYLWPFAQDKEGRKVDMRKISSEKVQTYDFHYAVELTDGWLALTDTASREGIGIIFPKDIFKVIWMWLVYGGWRGLYCAAIEIWTGYPAKLSEAVERGCFSQLGPNESLECDTKIVIYRDISEVEKITLEGDVKGDSNTLW